MQIKLTPSQKSLTYGFVTYLLTYVTTANEPSGTLISLLFALLAVLLKDIANALETPTPSAPTPTPQPSASSAQPAAGSAGGSAPKAQLPALPAGFNLADAKGNGFTVYENMAGNVIMSSPNVNAKGESITTWQTATGQIYPSAPDLSGYTKL